MAQLRRSFAVVTDRDSLNEDEVAEVLVGMSDQDAEAAYEFTLRWRRSVGGDVLLAEVFDESFQAFADMPDLFQWLGGRRAATLAQVKTALKRLGFTDVTKLREG